MKKDSSNTGRGHRLQKYDGVCGGVVVCLGGGWGGGGGGVGRG